MNHRRPRCRNRAVSHPPLRSVWGCYTLSAPDCTKQSTYPEQRRTLQRLLGNTPSNSLRQQHVRHLLSYPATTGGWRQHRHGMRHHAYVAESLRCPVRALMKLETAATSASQFCSKSTTPLARKMSCMHLGRHRVVFMETYITRKAVLYTGYQDCDGAGLSASDGRQGDRNTTPTPDRGAPYFK